MNTPTRRPTRILILHDGHSVDTYVDFLRAAGLQASESHADDAVSQTLAVEPDVVVLDFDCDGKIVAALQGDVRTRTVPVIALADLPSKRPD